MATLSEQERDRLDYIVHVMPYQMDDDRLDALVRVVEAILAARLAKVEALADEWEKSRLVWHLTTAAADLRAALASDPTHAQDADGGRG